MQLVDFILLLIIASFGLFGLWFGLIHTLGSLIGTIFGAFLASRFYEPFADLLIRWTGWEPNMSRLIVFIIAFVIINRLVGFGFWILDKVLSIVTRLPFINSINRFLGFVFGVLEGIVTLGLVIFFIERFPLSEIFMQQLAASAVAPELSRLAAILWPLLPDALRLLHSTVDYVTNAVQLPNSL